jgi:hypothetical protein
MAPGDTTVGSPPTTAVEAARLKQDTHAHSRTTIQTKDFETAEKGIGYVYLAAKVTYEGYERRRTHCVSICQQ